MFVAAVRSCSRLSLSSLLLGLWAGSLLTTRSINVNSGPRCNVARPMSELPDDFQTAHLAEVDPDIQRVLDGELGRQQGTLEMIASENFGPQAVLDAAGSVRTDKDAGGLPGQGDYGARAVVDGAG